MDIAFVTHNIRPGDGQGLVNREIVRGLAARGHRVTLYAHAVDAETAGWPGVTVRRVPALTRWGNLIKGLTFTAAVSAQLARRRHDLIHVNGGVYRGRHAVNTLHYCHSARPPAGSPYQRLYTWLNARFERAALRGAGHVTAISELIRGEAVRAGADPARLTVIPNGVDAARFNPRDRAELRAAARAELGLAPEQFTLLFVGDLATPRKGLGTLLEALAQTPDGPAVLLVVGDTRRNAFAAQAAPLGERVRFLGRRADVERLYAAADLFVFPTRYEPSGLVILEALAAGTPVITSAGAGAAEALTHGRDAWLLNDPTDAQELAAALRHLAAEPELREKLGAAGAAAAANFNWPAIAARYEALYEELLTTEKAP